MDDVSVCVEDRSRGGSAPGGVEIALVLGMEMWKVVLKWMRICLGCKEGVRG